MAEAGNKTGAGGARNVARATRKRKREPTPPAPPLGSIPKLDAFPGQTQAKQAGARAQRAKPAPVLPHVPVVRNPTPRQVVAAKTIVTHAVRQHAKRTGQSAAEATADLKADPRAQRFLKTAAHYAKADERQTAGMIGRALGARGSSEQVRLGRLAIARQAQRDQVHEGRGDRKVGVKGLASVNASALSRAVIGATSLDTGDIGPRSAFKKVASDVGALGTAPIIAGYEVGAGAADIARGKGTGRLERLGSGLVKGVVEEVKHPLKYAGEHPLLFALDVGGVTSVAGHAAGITARAVGSQAEGAGARGALARAGSRVRPPLALGEDANAPLFQREYSGDLTRKAVQASRDRTREPLLDKNGQPVTVRDRGREVPVLKATPREREKLLKGEGNFQAARANALERRVRSQVDKEFKVRGIRGRSAKDLVSMVVEGTITSGRHFEADLRAHRANIARKIEAGDYPHTGELASAKHRLALVDKALASPRVMGQAERIVSVGQDIGRRLNTMEKEAIRLGILHPTRAARSRLIVPAVEHLEARHYTPEEIKALPAEQVAAASEEALKHGGIRHSNGQYLSNSEIEDALRAKGRDPATVAYLPHRFDVRGRRAFHTRFQAGTRPTIDKPERRTGSAYAKGTTEASTELIREQAARLATQTTKAGSLDRMVSDYGLKKSDGTHFTAKEALEFSRRVEADTGERLIPVRAFPAKASGDARRKAMGQQTPGVMETLQQSLFNKRIVTKPGQAKNVVLMPAPLVEQLQKHLQPTGLGVEKFFQAINPAFRFAVLPQPRWLTGNFVEPYFIRLPLAGSGLLNIPGMGIDLATTSRIIKKMEGSDSPLQRRAAEELKAQQIGQGLFIGGRGAGVRRQLEELGKVGQAGAFVRDLPVVRQGIELLAMAPKSFFAANRVIETGAQRAGFGRIARRDLREITGSWWKSVRLGSKALEELANGLTNTPTQRRWMRSQHAMLGQYEGFPPALRRLTQSIMPFIPWYLNSLRLMYWTMPVHHTALTALIQQTNKVFEEDWKQVHKDVPPGSLKFAIPRADGGWADLARYTPWGATTDVLGGGNLRGLTDQIAPQFNGALAALEGKDPFGRELQYPKDTAHPGGKSRGLEDDFPVFLNQLAGSLVPGLSITQRLREGGGTPVASSNVFSPKTKPGSKHMSAWERTLSPIRPTYLTGPTSAPSVSKGPTSRQDQLLERAAERDAAGGLSDRQMELLERAAARAGG